MAIPLPEELKPWREYDQIHCNFSGGKDSLACVLLLLYGYKVPKEKLVLVHMRVDGSYENEVFFDWEQTDEYLNYCSEKLDIPLVTIFADMGLKERIEVRGKWPSSKQQYCTSYQKRDVYNKWVRNLGPGRFLCVTGERAQESPRRANKPTFEIHKTTAPTLNRYVDWYRPVHHLLEDEAWELMRLAEIEPHPCYERVSRCSCKFCIFLTPIEMGTVSELYPEEFNELIDMEKRLGHTMKYKNARKGETEGTSIPILDFVRQGNLIHGIRPCMV
jgi:3'-phosphoadenosine 5'-phosphosulfate sulfotransferase (PAPS reductase)/FAD synthetase